VTLEAVPNQRPETDRPEPGASAVPETQGPEQLKRSIDSLQRLYTIVVGLAVTEALRRFLIQASADPAAAATAGAAAAAGWWVNWKTLTILLVTIVPFYHGANGHLDQTYLYGFDGRRREKRYALVIDFFVLFGEGVLFFALALSLNDFGLSLRIFQAILLTDVLWAGFVHITGDSGKKDAGHALKWGLLNLVAFVAVSAVHDTALLVESARPNWVLGIAVLRTFFDYKICWDFYVARYPMPASADNA
jgi:hypothetical protein